MVFRYGFGRSNVLSKLKPAFAMLMMPLAAGLAKSLGKRIGKAVDKLVKHRVS